MVAENDQPLFVQVLNRSVGQPAPVSPRTLQTAISMAEPNDFPPAAQAVIQSLIDTIAHRTDIAQHRLDDRGRSVERLRATVQRQTREL
jgi:hypothetical protein